MNLYMYTTKKQIGLELCIREKKTCLMLVEDNLF